MGLPCKTLQSAKKNLKVSPWCKTKKELKVCHANRHTREEQSVTALNKEKPILEKTLKAKE